MSLDSKIPAGKMDEKWTDYKGHVKLVNPANKRKLEIIVVGTGLAGASAAASLGEMGYKVKAFCFQDSPRRAHSIAAQGGINAAKTMQEANSYSPWGSALSNAASNPQVKQALGNWSTTFGSQASPQLQNQVSSLGSSTWNPWSDYNTGANGWGNYGE